MDVQYQSLKDSVCIAAIFFVRGITTCRLGGLEKCPDCQSSYAKLSDLVDKLSRHIRDHLIDGVTDAVSRP